MSLSLFSAVLVSVGWMSRYRCPTSGWHLQSFSTRTACKKNSVWETEAVQLIVSNRRAVLWFRPRLEKLRDYRGEKGWSHELHPPDEHEFHSRCVICCSWTWILFEHAQMSEHNLGSASLEVELTWSCPKISWKGTDKSLSLVDELTGVRNVSMSFINSSKCMR